MGKKRKLAHMAAKKQKPAAHAKSSSSSSNHQTSHNKHGFQKTGTQRTGRLPASKSGKGDGATPAPPQERPTIPFHPEDDAILLVGEGDLSFAASLVERHNCLHLTATVLEDGPDALAAKFPQAADNAACIEAGGGRVLYGVDAKNMGPWTTKGGAEKVGTMDRIFFNFPHVGGKSTDVNRQVRHNQELLVAFFKRALLSLAPGGSIVVTLFEGEPYTLWNIRDLGRHAGLQVERSFRFQFGAYPGYHHARTLGVVRRRTAAAGGEEDNSPDSAVGEESTSAWRGEDRAARSYVFVRKDEVPKPVPRKKRKRAGDDSSDSDDGDDDDD